MKNYKCQIISAKDLFELSCVDELIRDAFYNRKAISQEAYEMRKKEYLKKKKELENRGVSQRELATRTGITEVTISRYVSG